MGSEMQNKLSKINMLVLTPSQPVHTCEIHEGRAPLKIIQPPSEVPCQIMDYCLLTLKIR